MSNLKMTPKTLTSLHIRAALNLPRPKRLITLARRAAIGLSLASSLGLSVGCGDYSMEDGSYAYHESAPSLRAPAPHEALPSEAIIDGVEVTYNQEEDASLDNLLTFAVDVDTASYTIARSHLESGRLPPKEVIRVEEFINFFDYRDEAPATLKDSPFAVHMDAAKAPFAENRTLLRIGLKGYEVPDQERPATSLVFLIDTSGSMSGSIELVKQSLGLLLDSLNPTDSIAIVTYAGNSSIALRPTPVSERSRILNAMNRLSSGGGTNGAGGINAAYDLAQNAFKEDGLNRVVLCTDGDFNVGVTGQALYDLIEEKRESGITLSVLGFGGRYNDAQMEQLADRGNGNYSFIDSLREAQRALVDRLTATLMVIAKDVKIQLEVNPTIVKTYRLLGYENRAIADNDFRNDRVDAGEIGAGHSVTALVELELYPEGERPTIEELGAVISGSADVEAELADDESADEEITDEITDEEITDEEITDEITDEEITDEEITDEITDEEPIERAEPLQLDPAFAREDAPVALLRLRNKTPDASAEDPAVEQVHELSLAMIREDAKRATPQLQFAAAVAELAEILRESPFVESADFDKIIELAEASRVEGDEWMAEFVSLVEVAQSLYTRR